MAVGVVTGQAVHDGPEVFPDRFEVRVLRESGGPHLAAAVVLVGPGNKTGDRPRRAFLATDAEYLYAGVCAIVVDAVTDPSGNLHNDLCRFLRRPNPSLLPTAASPYAATYRPVTRGGDDEVDVWTVPFAVGDPLPTMPLRLVADYFVPVELELTYTEACRRRRLV